MQHNQELLDLLQDKTFVDFFNVFLSLPIFAQRILYKYEQKDFEFDPPVRKSKYRLDKTKIIKWLSTERLPLFVNTVLYHEYSLCQHLQSTRLYFSQSSHDLDYVEHKHKEDTKFISQCIGNVIGMRKFRHYLRGTVGERMLNFWIDAECFKCIPTQDIGKKWTAYRDMQTKYFKGKNIGTFDTVKGNENILLNSNWTGHQNNYKCSVDKHYEDTPSKELIQIMESTDYTGIQNIIILALKGYWFQRYALKCRILKEKQDEKSTEEAVYRILNKSDIAILKDIKEIDKALQLLQVDSVAHPEVLNKKAMHNWKAMFPEHKVDSSFLDQEGDIITMHKNGTVSVDPIDSTLDDVLAKYITADISSSNDEDYEFELGQKDEKTSATSQEAKRAETVMCTTKHSKGIVEVDSVLKAKFHSNDDKEKCFFPSLSQGIMVNQQKNENSDKDQTDSQKSHTNTKATTTKSLDLIRKVVSSEMLKKDVKYSTDNMELFNQLLQLTYSTTDETAQKEIPIKRPQSTPMKPLPINRKITLPSIVSSKIAHDSKATISQCHNGIDNLSLPLIEESKFAVTVTESENYLEPPPPGGKAVHIETPTFQYKNICEGYFRYENRFINLCMATDSIAGYPFKQFLMRQNCCSKLVTCLHFWNDAEEYLTTMNIDHAVKTRRAQLIVVRYLLNKKVKLLPSALKSALQRLLPVGKGDAVLREAQDFVCKELHPTWKKFNHVDKKNFNRLCIHAKPRWKRKTCISEDELMIMDSTQNDRSLAVLENELEEEMEQQNVISPEKERLMFRAIQFALDASCRFDEGIPVEPLKVNELVWDARNEHGSLFVDKLVLIQRRDLVEYKNRLRSIAERKKAMLELEKIRMREKIKKNVENDNIPFYLKPFKKGGEVFERPSRPRTFQDILKDSTHREFFRRFLIFNNADAPMNFCNSVEELKQCTDPRSKQTRTTQITRKYFPSVATATELLNTTADIVQAIPSQEKVTIAMLISAQSWVARALHDNWFEKYQNTFPEVDKEAVLAGTINLLTDGGNRRWGKERTRKLWQAFVRSVIQFRRDLLDSQRSKLFEKFLKSEIRKEVGKQKLTQAYAHGMPIRKVIRNKLIDVTKLVNDMHFVAEADRYRTLCDDARNSASFGEYCMENEKMIENKAKLIVDCFIDSDIPPRTQINLSTEQTEDILSSYKGGLHDRSLFHHANINIFPVVLYLWKKFEKNMYIKLYERWEAKQKLRTSSEFPDSDISYVSNIPDYINTTMQNIIVKRAIPPKGEEDLCKISFSMSQGMKMTLPLFTPGHFGFSYNASNMQSRTERGNSTFDGRTLQKGPSFLKNRRYAVVSGSKINMSSQHTGTSHAGIKHLSVNSSKHRGSLTPIMQPPPEMLQTESRTFGVKLPSIVPDV